MHKLVFSILITFYWLPAVAANPAPILGIKDFKNEKHTALIAEILLPYVVKEYVQPVRLQVLAARGDSDFSSPESTLQGFFSSLNAADFAWNRDFWTVAARNFNDQKDKASGLSAQYWEQRWKSQYSNKQVDLTRRIEYGKFVIIEYKLTHPAVTKVLESDTLALVKEGDKWLLTQELAKNPILYGWKSPTGRVQLGPSFLDQNTK